ncbi:carbohydrate ABC transporter permease [Ferviditalea candida]|uniref:Sugar ABC transporter permease n=1 Tax=Ferviditalea candida TaxID=3108399 RepID=A0ABU5ZI19_9BACL|nr:sugar ABC transporter permease [Paenibacillaceae bacterium T2]
MKAITNHTSPELKTQNHLGPRLDWGLRWYLYVAPMIIVIVGVFGYPLVSVIRYSFYAGNMNRLIYVGLANYKAIFQDPVFWISIRNNVFLLISVPIMIVIAMLLAILLYEAVKGWKFYRSVVFLPYIVSATVIGITFSYLYQFNGVLNTSLRAIGLDAIALDWLGNSHLVVPSVMSVILYQQIGFGVVLFFAQMINLPSEVFEAAELDGVNWWQKQWLVTIPQLKGVIEFFAITEAINMLSWVFNYVYVLTAGGPGNSSSVLEIYIWRNAFFFRSYGSASAVATILLIITVVLIFVYFRIRSGNMEQRGES